VTVDFGRRSIKIPPYKPQTRICIRRLTFAKFAFCRWRIVLNSPLQHVVLLVASLLLSPSSSTTALPSSQHSLNMGVNGLWPVCIYSQSLTHCGLVCSFCCQIIAPAAKQHNFKELIIREGFESRSGVRAYRLGIDIRYVCFISTFFNGLN
jgi:hypothetical protein